MKKASLIIAVVVCLVACKKEKTPALFSVVGKWELRNTTGSGLTGNQADYPAGSGYQIYDFKADSSFTIYRSNAVNAMGNYHTIISNKTGANTYGTIAISAGNYTDTFKLSKDTLVLGAVNATGISYHLSKQINPQKFKKGKRYYFA